MAQRQDQPPAHAGDLPAPSGRQNRQEPRIITLQGQAVPYTLRVSARARLVRLVIRPATGLEVVAPRGATEARIQAVLREKASWITRTLARLRVAPTAPDASPAPERALTDGQALPYAGRELHLALVERAPDVPAGRFRAALDGETLTLRLAGPATQEAVRAALVAWYRRQARAVFAERLAVCNASFGFAYGRVSIKDQKSRWGSCSRQGNLNFNWRLLLAPPPVLDYVVVHELAHLRELNHSPRFWRLVASACPDYQALRRWLRQHGQELHL